MNIRFPKLACFTKRNFFRLAVLLVIDAAFAFGADEKESETPVAASETGTTTDIAREAMPEWARGWSVLWVSFPSHEKPDKPQVELQQRDGTEVSLSLDEQTPDGVKLADFAWVDTTMATAVVTLEKAGERATFPVGNDFIARCEIHRPDALQIEIDSRFIEIGETSARRLKSPAGGGKARDHTGIDLLSARLGGEASVHVLTRTQYEDLLVSLAGQKGVDLLSAPRVTTKAKQKAIIEIIREFRYPTEFAPMPDGKEGWIPKTFETRNCGVTLEASPDVDDAGAITLGLVPQVVAFLGFRDIDSGKKYPANTALARSLSELASPHMMKGQQYPTRAGWRALPVFSTRKIESTVTLLPGNAVLFIGVPEAENTERFPSRAASHRLAVLVTARMIHPNGETRSSLEAPPQNAPVQIPKKGGRLAGIVVPEKPGFIRSPFAPDEGFVDVRGFPPGTEVKCPYSGNLFLVP